MLRSEMSHHLAPNARLQRLRLGRGPRHDAARFEIRFSTAGAMTSRQAQDKRSNSVMTTSGKIARSRAHIRD